MKKKYIGITLILIGALIFLLTGLFGVIKKQQNNDTDDDNYQVSDTLKEQLDNKINNLTSYLYCNSGRSEEDRASCIYLRDKTHSEDISNDYRLYYVVLSSINESEKVSVTDDEAKYFGEDMFLLTNYIDADKIKEKYFSVYGQDSSFDLTSADNLEVLPKVMYDEEQNIYLISNDERNFYDNYVLSKNVDYKIEDDYIYVYANVVYARKYTDEEIYFIYPSLESTTTVENVTLEDFQNYDVGKLKDSQCTKYKFTFKKQNGDYIFQMVEKNT